MRIGENSSVRIFITATQRRKEKKKERKKGKEGGGEEEEKGKRGETGKIKKKNNSFSLLLTTLFAFHTDVQHNPSSIRTLLRPIYNSTIVHFILTISKIFWSV